MATDYISRSEAVNDIFDQACAECKDACLEFDGFMPDCEKCLLHKARSQFELIPAADVRPVVTGKWIEEDGTQICSECGDEHSWVEYRASFCECCGADMRRANNG